MIKDKGIIKEAFKTKRGAFTIRGDVYRMKDEKMPQKAVIISHPFMMNKKTMSAYGKWFAQRGYIAFVYDFCGGGLGSKSDGKTTDMSVFTEEEDLKAVLGFVQRYKMVNPEHILLMGCSQGGFVSALTAALLPDAVRALILFYPALCIPDDARKGKMMFAKFDPGNIPTVFWCGPMKLGREYPASVLKLDPFEAIRTYPGPVLLAHGTGDTVVPVLYAQKAFDAYTQGDEQMYPEKQLFLIEGAQHGFWGKYDVAARERLQVFLDEYG